jgi:hypothetical protein
VGDYGRDLRRRRRRGVPALRTTSRVPGKHTHEPRRAHRLPTLEAIENTREDRGQFISVEVDSEIYDALREIAEDHERSLAGEVRYLLRRYACDPDLLDQD